MAKGKKRRRGQSGNGGYTPSWDSTRNTAELDTLIQRTFDRALHGDQTALPANISFLQRVWANVNFVSRQPTNPNSRRRPYLVWGRYFDEHGDLKAVDCIRSATQFAKLYPSDFKVDAEPLKKLTQADTEVLLGFGNIFYFKNILDVFDKNTGGIVDLSLLPDFILRRVTGILYSRENPDTGQYILDQSLTRIGLVFNNVSFRENQAGLLAPEAPDAPFKQKPLIPVQRDRNGEITFTLSQKEIDRICRIARNYAQYCRSQNLPIKWPYPGIYRRWPEEFLQFEHGYPNYEIRLPWFGSKAHHSAPDRQP